MSDPLYDLLSSQRKPTSAQGKTAEAQHLGPEVSSKYLSRLLSLRLTDLTTTEPQSIAQASQSNLLSIQALSSRSHKTTTLSSDHLSTLKDSLPHITNSTKEVRESIPALDESAVTFASAYSKSRESENASLAARKEAQLLARQADKLQEILELPSLLSAAIASAGSGAAGSANYSQALDLFAHIKRLQIIFPDSQLIQSVLVEAEAAMKDMTTNLLSSLRSQNIRLAAAIRTIGWLRRVVPELNNPHHTQPLSPQAVPANTTTAASVLTSTTDVTQTEGSFGALFLTARLATFISMTQALAPLRELADQETDRRLQQQQQQQQQQQTASTDATTTTQTPTSSSRRASAQPTTSTTITASTSTSSISGHQTERYLKRYIEIFREQSFSMISMYRNIFPSGTNDTNPSSHSPLPPSLQTLPLHLVELLMEVLQAYLPNITDTSARESLLMQVLYAANSLGRLGADFSMMIALLDEDGKPDTTEPAGEEHAVGEKNEVSTEEAENDPTADTEKIVKEPTWLRVIKKHRVQSARLDALAAGQDESVRRSSQDIAVR